MIKTSYVLSIQEEGSIVEVSRVPKTPSNHANLVKDLQRQRIKGFKAFITTATEIETNGSKELTAIEGTVRSTGSPDQAIGQDHSGLCGTDRLILNRPSLTFPAVGPKQCQITRHEGIWKTFLVHDGEPGKTVLAHSCKDDAFAAHEHNIQILKHHVLGGAQ